MLSWHLVQSKNFLRRIIKTIKVTIKHKSLNERISSWIYEEIFKEW